MNKEKNSSWKNILAAFFLFFLVFFNGIHLAECLFTIMLCIGFFVQLPMLLIIFVRLLEWLWRTTVNTWLSISHEALYFPFVILVFVPVVVRFPVIMPCFVPPPTSSHWDQIVHNVELHCEIWWRFKNKYGLIFNFLIDK